MHLNVILIGECSLFVVVVVVITRDYLSPAFPVLRPAKAVLKN